MNKQNAYLIGLAMFFIYNVYNYNKIYQKKN